MGELPSASRIAIKSCEDEIIPNFLPAAAPLFTSVLLI
jgi:hypothetical protein